MIEEEAGGLAIEPSLERWISGRKEDTSEEGA